MVEEPPRNKLDKPSPTTPLHRTDESDLILDLISDLISDLILDLSSDLISDRIVGLAGSGGSGMRSVNQQIMGIISFQKMYGLHGPDHHQIEIKWDATDT